MAGTTLDDVIRISRSQPDGSLTLPNVTSLMRQAQLRGNAPATLLSMHDGTTPIAKGSTSPREAPRLVRQPSIGESVRDLRRESFSAAQSERTLIEPRRSTTNRGPAQTREPIESRTGMGFHANPAAIVGRLPIDDQERLARLRPAEPHAIGRDLERAPLADQREQALAVRQDIEQTIEGLHAQQTANRQLLRSAADAIRQMIEEIRAAHNEFDRIRDSLRNR